MEDVKMKQRDLKTLKRIMIAKKQSDLLEVFFEKGFKSFDALKAIILNYYPNTSEKRLWDFWHFRVLDEEITDQLDNVLDKLKTE